MKPAFSAVELLLVAGISAILVAIAVPGYMEAKVRAEVVDVKYMLRNVNHALIQYSIDYSQFPEMPSVNTPHPLKRLQDNRFLTARPEDRFKKGLQGYGSYYTDSLLDYNYMDLEKIFFRKVRARLVSNASLITNNNQTRGPWYLRSIGPDQTDWRDEGGGRGSGRANEFFTEYNPTNGVFSLGEIILVQNDNS